MFLIVFCWFDLLESTQCLSLNWPISKPKAMLWGKKNPTDGSDKSLEYPTVPPPFLLRPWLIPLGQSEPVASRVHVVHGPKQKTLGIPSFSLAANFWRVLSSHASCEPWSVVSAALEAGAAVGIGVSDGDGDEDGVGVSDHCILILICTFLRASGSCLALSCRSLSSLAAYVRGLQTIGLLSLSLSLLHTLSPAHYEAANGSYCCRLCKICL